MFSAVPTPKQASNIMTTVFPFSSHGLHLHESMLVWCWQDVELGGSPEKSVCWMAVAIVAPEVFQMTGSFILGNDSTHQKLWSMHQKKSYKAHRADVGNCDFFLVLVDELELRKWDLPGQTPPGHKRMGRPGSILRSPLLTKLAEFSLCRLPERRQGSGWDLGREDQYQNLCTWRGCGITTILRQEPGSQFLHLMLTIEFLTPSPNCSANS